jgi:hypothetical protein
VRGGVGTARGVSNGLNRGAPVARNLEHGRGGLLPPFRGQNYYRHGYYGPGYGYLDGGYLSPYDGYYFDYYPDLVYYQGLPPLTTYPYYPSVCSNYTNCAQIFSYPLDCQNCVQNLGGGSYCADQVCGLDI